MLYFRPGSHASRLLTVLSVAGEVPTSAIRLLGNERVCKALVVKMTKTHKVRNLQTEAEINSQVLVIAGRAQSKRVRLFKTALPLLDWIHPDALSYYLSSFTNHKFSSHTDHIKRNFRMAESVIMCMNAGIEFRPYVLPKLQNRDRLKIVPDYPSFYMSKDVKRVGEFEGNKTLFTRMVGVLFGVNQCYIVYNTRNSLMKWSGRGELKAQSSIRDVVGLNAGTTDVNSAIIIAKSDTVILDTIAESEKIKTKELRFNSIYNHIHYIPMNDNGMRLLRILTLPDWNEKILDMLFSPEIRAYNRGFFEYDAYKNGVYILSHLDGDIARLMNFKDGLASNPEPLKAMVICYPFQAQFLQEYLGRLAKIKTFDMDLVEKELGLEYGGTIFG